MIITNCPRCGSMNITTAGVCANCGWSQFNKSMVSTDVLLDVATPIDVALRKRIAELEAERRWIPVSERLPQIGVRVLFYNNFITNIHKGWFSGDEWTSDIGIFYNGDKLKRITHWMPLPEPPEVSAGTVNCIGWPAPVSGR